MTHVVGGAPGSDAGAGGRWENLQRRWQGRARRWAEPEVVAASIMMAAVAVAGGAVSGSAVVVVLLSVVALSLHLAAVESGDLNLIWAATGLFVGFAVVVGSDLGDLSPVGWTVAGLSALAYNELVRLSHARRRQAEIDDGVYGHVGAGFALVVAVTVAAVVLAQTSASTGSGGRAWWWMPLISVVLLVTAVVLAVLPGWGATKPRPQAPWQPGERLPPPPLRRSRSDRM